MEVSKKDENGETVVVKADRCFTDESYLIVKMPTYSEKLKLQSQLKNAEKDPEQNYLMICDLVDDVDCLALDNNERISTLDDLTAFADGALVIEWLTALLGTGFVPKKKLTV